nr:MAG TPA: hypothetical protein [Caudoviricetes sp.]
MPWVSSLQMDSYSLSSKAPISPVSRTRAAATSFIASRW